MTTSLYLASIADAISQISVSGVTIKDKDQVAASWLPLPDVLYPHPDNWIDNFSVRFDSVLQGAPAPMTIIYTLHYRFLHVAVGDLSGMPTSYSELVDKVIAIINALIAVPSPYSGKVSMVVGTIQLGLKSDPAGNQYYGADITLAIEEMQN